VILTLEDKHAISDVIAAYAHAVDRRRWDVMHNVFHDDATFAFGTVQGSWRDFVDQARLIIEACVATHHQLGQILISGDGPHTAHAETYMTAMHIVPPGYPVPGVFPDRGEEYSAVIAGRYVDRFERRAGSWRITHRRGIYDWREYRTIGPASLADVPAQARGSHDDNDASTPVVRDWRGS
jgi:SnoaL-like domain